MNKHVNKVRKATGRAEAITAGRQQDKQQYLIIQLMKNKESIKTGQERMNAFLCVMFQWLVGAVQILFYDYVEF